LGEGGTGRLAFQAIRLEAWTNTQSLQAPRLAAATRRGMAAAHVMREALVLRLPAEQSDRGADVW
jgi:hypothetical protein